MELKTLKDLNRIDNYKGMACNAISISDLKAEAVKWVRFYDKCTKLEVDWRKGFVEFFNLTEEDLGEKEK